MADNNDKPLMKCFKCGKEKFNTRLCAYFSGGKKVICADCCKLLQEKGKCKVRGCPYKNL
ncbi:MAG: hypothetical protein EU551_01980 [Promethearchaeota archaeon]|nr:MAG: hypothetical protein EU551_01980 [Candidatus Lokiarchaeota archaeon]